MNAQLDSANHFCVGIAATGHVHVHNIWQQAPGSPCSPMVLTKDEALNLAGWIIALTDPDWIELARMCREIKGR